MIHKKTSLCVVRHPNRYGWTDIFVLPSFFTKRLKVCVCALSPPRGRKRGDINTFHLVKWSALHCSAKRRQNPWWRKQFLNVKSSETFTILWCMTMDPHLFFIYIYLHTYRQYVDLLWLVKDERNGSGIVPISPHHHFSFSSATLFSLRPNSPYLTTFKLWTWGHPFSISRLSLGLNISSVSFWRTVVTVRTASFGIKEKDIGILCTLGICVFCISCRINSDYFPKQS